MDDATRSQILQKLQEVYGADSCALQFEQPLDLLVATILSAQCTDRQVNIITRDLFIHFKTAQDYAALTPEELEPYIKSCGFYHHKARNICLACRMLVAEYGGEVPRTMEELTKLPGVGRKTANVVLANAFGQDAIAVDTHVFRVSNRLGLAHADQVYETEMQLREAIPQSLWSQAHHWLIWHGRRICHAQRPNCNNCPCAGQCEAFQEGRVPPVVQRHENMI